ncbi:cobalamin-binding protein [Halomonas sp. Bachu 37]|uniref:cobalamin-binding protein n=1 Tax=Halomonas kashgarensis TaxID=3084920 RepID=UPI003217B41F
MNRALLLVLAFLLGGQAATAQSDGISQPLADDSERCAVDDKQRRVCLETPARRIVALSPGATELAYAAGAGKALVGVVSHSDYPPQAAELPRVGSHSRLDLEALAALRPDLVLGWASGNPTSQMETLQALGIPMFYLEPNDVEGIAGAIERLGVLAATGDQAKQEAQRFRQAMAQLQQRYGEKDPITIFYQVWHSPLMTVNGEHWISDAIERCGGINIFAGLERLAPPVDLEAVLAADPDAIVSGGRGEDDTQWLQQWRVYPELTAVQRDNLFLVPPSLLQRPTPRLAEGTALLCEQLQDARMRR